MNVLGVLTAIGLMIFPFLIAPPHIDIVPPVTPIQNPILCPLDPSCATLPLIGAAGIIGTGTEITIGDQLYSGLTPQAASETATAPEAASAPEPASAEEPTITGTMVFQLLNKPQEDIGIQITSSSNDLEFDENSINFSLSFT